MVVRSCQSWGSTAGEAEQASSQLCGAPVRTPQPLLLLTGSLSCHTNPMIRLKTQGAPQGPPHTRTSLSFPGNSPIRSTSQIPSLFLEPGTLLPSTKREGPPSRVSVCPALCSQPGCALRKPHSHRALPSSTGWLLSPRSVMATESHPSPQLTNPFLAPFSTRLNDPPHLLFPKLLCLRLTSRLPSAVF